MAKYYYAKMHVSLGDYIARPGEVIEGDFSEEETERLLKIGAICECGQPEGVPCDDPPAKKADEDSASAKTEAEYAADTDDEEAESEEEEPAPAQIDVMDGVTPAAAPAESAAPKTTRKARGGKTK